AEGGRRDGAVAGNQTGTSPSGNPKVGTFTQTVATGLTGTDSGNYTFAGFTSTANYTINQLALNGAIGSASSTYGSALTPGTASFTNVVGTDVVSPTGAVTVNTTGNSTSGNPKVGTLTQTSTTRDASP